MTQRSMEPLALAVVQLDAEADPETALAALPAARRYLLRPPELAALPAPPGVHVLVADCRDRREAAAVVRREFPAGVVVVLEPAERLSPTLACALVDLCRCREQGAWAVRRTFFFLGREVNAGAEVIAWRGDPAAEPARRALGGVLTKLELDIAGTIAALDAGATRVAAARSAVGVADFVVRPAGALVRRLLARWRDGMPGLILSILETYGDVLAAAKVWERVRMQARRQTLPSTRTVPQGFAPIETPTGWVVVRQDVGERLLGALLDATPESVAGEPLVGRGRGATWALGLGDGRRAVLRWYRRGGLLRHLVRDRYFGWRPRPMIELGVIERARHRGVAAVEVLAARVDRLAGGFYRGAIVTREIERAETLAEVLRRRPPDAERAAVTVAVARTLRDMHDRGVHHRDLNVTNILLRPEGESIGVHLIDFDRAQLRARIPPRVRRRALRRLGRSLAKLDPESALITAEDRAAFHRAYRGCTSRGAP